MDINNISSGNTSSTDTSSSDGNSMDSTNILDMSTSITPNNILSSIGLASPKSSSGKSLNNGNSNNSGSNSGRSSPLITNTSPNGNPNAAGTANSSTKLVPVHMSPKSSSKKLLMEKQPSSLMLSSSDSVSVNGIAGVAVGADGASLRSASPLTTSSADAPIAALIAKSVAIGNFMSNNQTSVRFYAGRLEFSIATHPQLFEKAVLQQSLQSLASTSGNGSPTVALTQVTLQYADMTGISIAGTKLRFKIPRRCCVNPSFAASFDADASLFQFAIDLNSVVSSSIVKQKVMPLICPQMFGGAGGGTASPNVSSKG
jgi:hypothetical protein